MSYEIVRCDRNELDRTIITQGIMGSLLEFTDWEEYRYNFGSNDIRPAPMFNLVSDFKTKSGGFCYDSGGYFKNRFWTMSYFC